MQQTKEVGEPTEFDFEEGSESKEPEEPEAKRRKVDDSRVPGEVDSDVTYGPSAKKKRGRPKGSKDSVKRTRRFKRRKLSQEEILGLLAETEEDDHSYTV